MTASTVHKEPKSPIEVAEVRKGSPSVQKEQQPIQDYKMRSEIVQKEQNSLQDHQSKSPTF